MVDNLFLPNTILEKSMQASVLRNDVIQNNIANADTPNFKRQEVQFEPYLQGVLEEAEISRTLELDYAQPKIVTQGFSYRLDDNNVDIETEMVDMYKNSTRYDMMTNSVMNNYKKINVALGK